MSNNEQLTHEQLTHEQLTHEEQQLRIIDALPANANANTNISITINDTMYVINTNRLFIDMQRFNINRRQAVYLQAIRLASN